MSNALCMSCPDTSAVSVRAAGHGFFYGYWFSRMSA